MAQQHSTHPWNASYFQNEGFGFYISGLIDGEGHFQLAKTRQTKSGHLTNKAEFNIAMRDDDAAILYRIKDFWNCGCIARYDPAKWRKDDDYNRKPMIRYIVGGMADMASIIVPHFDRYPLLAKKSRDFALWKEGVLMLHAKCRKEWTSQENRRFEALICALKAQRRYGSSVIEPPARCPQHPTLFDDL